jgi:hypothetical protein
MVLVRVIEDSPTLHERRKFESPRPFRPPSLVQNIPWILGPFLLLIFQNGPVSIPPVRIYNRAIIVIDVAATKSYSRKLVVVGLKCIETLKWTEKYLQMAKTDKDSLMSRVIQS